MLDSYLMLAPMLLLPVAALLRFIGCQLVFPLEPADDVTVIVTPDSVNLGPGQAQQFTAMVDGVASAAVTWSTDSAAPVAPDGLFTAPAPFVLGSPAVKVTATSSQTPASSAFATVTLIGTGARFVPPPDLIPQGSWNGVYGQAGFALADRPADLVQLPAFLPTLTLPPQSQVFQFQDPSVDIRALQRPPAFADRFSSAWFNNVGAAPALAFDFAFADFQVHRVAFYFCDFDNQNRTQKIEVFDISQAGAPVLLDTQTIAGFVAGQYLVWELQGKVRMQITKVAGLDVILHGIFFTS